MLKSKQYAAMQKLNEKLYVQLTHGRINTLGALRMMDARALSPPCLILSFSSLPPCPSSPLSLEVGPLNAPPAGSGAEP
jgi:hypothetical protein